MEAALAKTKTPTRHRPSVMSLDLLTIAPVVDRVVAAMKKKEPGANRATVVRELLIEALTARGEMK